jgi:hypothetical protein
VIRSELRSPHLALARVIDCVALYVELQTMMHSDDQASEPSNSEAFEQGDEALDETSRTDPDFIEQLEEDQTPRLTRPFWSMTSNLKKPGRSSTIPRFWPRSMLALTILTGLHRSEDLSFVRMKKAGIWTRLSSVSR